MAKNTHIIVVKTQGAGKSKQQLDGVTNSLKQMATKVAAASAVVYGLKKAMDTAFDLVRASAKVEQLGRGFDNLGKKLGFTGASLGKLRAAVNGTVDDMGLMQQANNAMMLGVVQTDEEMAQLFDTAQRLGQALGLDTTDAVNSLVTGMGRQSKLMLDNLGIMVNMEEAYNNFAIANNTTVEAMTDSEKKIAFNNETLRKAGELTDALGSEVLGTAEKLAQMDTAILNARTSIGETLAPVVVDMAEFFGTAAVNVSKFFQSFHQTELEKTIADIKELGGDTTKLDLSLIKLEKNEAINKLGGNVRDINDVYKETKDINDKILENSQSKVDLENDILAITSEQKTASGELITLEELLRREKMKKGNWFQDSEFILQLEQLKNEKDRLEALEKTHIATRNNLNDEAKLIEKINRLKLKEKLLMEGKTASEIKAIVEGEKQDKKGEEQEFSSAKQAISNSRAKAEATLVTKIMNSTPFPLNLILAKGAGAMVDKLFAGITAAQYGADFVADKPQLMMVGEGSGPERVQVTPLADPNIDGPQGQGITLNISGNVLHESFIEDSVIPQIREGLRLGENIGL